MMIIFHLVSSLLAFIVFPAFTLFSWVTGKKRRGLWHHFGFADAPPPSRSGTTVWVHALSRGEVVAATPIVKQLRERRPDIRIIVSVTTDSGYDAAHQYLGFVEQIRFHPFDCLPFLLLALRQIKPQVFVLAETGFWPGMMDLLKNRNIPAILFNARVSPKSKSAYKRFGFFFAPMLNGFAQIGVQNQQGLDDFLELGVEESKLKLTGDTKFDALETVTSAEHQVLLKEYGLGETDLVLVAGSTHAGEEEILLSAYEKVRVTFPQLVMIIAPRRLERLPQLVRLLDERNLKFVKRTEIAKGGRGTAGIILLDTMGELVKTYSLATVTFVGNSLIAPGGGHSLIEPASLGKVVLHGPHLDYKKSIADELARSGATIRVADVDDLERQILKLFSNTADLARIGDSAKDLIDSKKGASDSICDLVVQALG